MTNDVWMCGERGKGNCRTEKTKLFLGRYFMLEWGRDGNFLFPCMILTWKRLKTGDCKDSDYGMEKPSSLWCLISLHVKIETITQIMSRADEFEKSIWKECSGQKIIAPQIIAMCQNCVLLQLCMCLLFDTTDFRFP